LLADVVDDTKYQTKTTIKTDFWIKWQWTKPQQWRILEHCFFAKQ